MGYLFAATALSAIGGFLFGYDTGVVSGAMLIIHDEWGLQSWEEELAVSVTIAFAIVGALAGGRCNEFFGRKKTIVASGAIFVAGSVALGLAGNFPVLLVGRSVVGVAIGIASMTAPMYIAEISPPAARGRLVTINNCMITGGQFVASLVCWAFSDAAQFPHGWRWMLGLGAVPAFVMLVGFAFMPESPRWFMNHGRREEATAALAQLRGLDTASPEVRAEIDAMDGSRGGGGGGGGERGGSGRGGGSGVNGRGSAHAIKNAPHESSSLRAVCASPALRRALCLGGTLQVVQQLSGINTVMYYSATIIVMAGVKDRSTAILIAAAVSLVNFVFTFVGVFLVDRLGRRKVRRASELIEG
jgi:SP family myo-inositol transporter-like MFS transporter 13